MTFTDEQLVATVAQVTRRRFGTFLQIFGALKRSDESLADLDEASLHTALDRLVDEGQLDRGADAMYSVPHR